MKNIVFTLIITLTTLSIYSQENAEARINPDQRVNTTSLEKTDMLKLRKECSNTLRSYIVNHFSYPEYLVENNIDGQVKVEVVINKEGKVEEVLILESPHVMLSDSLSTFLSNTRIQELNAKGKNLTTHVTLKYTFKPF